MLGLDFLSRWFGRNDKQMVKLAERTDQNRTAVQQATADIEQKIPVEVTPVKDVAKPVTAKIVKKDDGYHVMSEQGKSLGGPYDSESKAEKRLKQVEFFKHNAVYVPPDIQRIQLAHKAAASYRAVVANKKAACRVDPKIAANIGGIILLYNTDKGKLLGRSDYSKAVHLNFAPNNNPAARIEVVAWLTEKGMVDRYEVTGYWPDGVTGELKECGKKSIGGKSSVTSVIKAMEALNKRSKKEEVKSHPTPPSVPKELVTPEKAEPEEGPDVAVVRLSQSHKTAAVSQEDLGSIDAWEKTLISFINTQKPNTKGEKHLQLGNVDFWVDSEGPWAGQLSSSIPNEQWDVDAIAADYAKIVGSIKLSKYMEPRKAQRRYYKSAADIQVDYTDVLVTADRKEVMAKDRKGKDIRFAWDDELSAYMRQDAGAIEEPTVTA